MTECAFDWNEKSRETFKRDGSALVLDVGMEMAVRIKDLSAQCGLSGHFNEQRWQDGLAELLGYRLPRLQFGETYKLVIH